MLLNVGADCSLLESPENTKFMFPMLLLLGVAPWDEDEEALADEPEPERSNIQGTATCLPEPVRLASDPWPEVPAVADWLEAPGWVALLPAPVELVVSVSAPPLAWPALDTERTAKSTRPDIGLIITSLSVPSC